MSLYLHTVKYEPLGGSSYIPLPGLLAAKKAIINIKNEDNECFNWAITRALNAVGKNSERIDINFIKIRGPQLRGLKFPVNLSDIKKFENRNSSISVNVFGYENFFILLE